MLSEYQMAMAEHLLAHAEKLHPRFPLCSAGEFLRMMKEPEAESAPVTVPMSDPSPRREAAA